MRIYIYAGYCIPVHARVLDERPLGGTETGIVQIAEALTARGHDVVVFTSHRSPPPSRPLYLPAQQIGAAPPCDVLIAVQDWHGCLLPVQAKRRFFWTGDGAEQFVNFGFGDKRVQSVLSGVLAVSEWHRLHLAEESGFPIDRIATIYNGVDLARFQGTERRDRFRLIYSSAPYRGLILAPAIFEMIHRRVPEAELHVFAGLDIYDRDKPFEGPEKVQYENLRRQLLKLPNCYVHGNVTQSRLARELMKSGLFFYPNIFRETSCIAALEGLAAGLPVVTSRLGALPETVGEAGITVAEEPGSLAYLEAFVAACTELLTDEKRWQDLSAKAPTRVRSWQEVADRLLAAVC